MAQEAGPSSLKQQKKTKPKTPAPTSSPTKQLSKEFIDSDGSDESEAEDDVDSEGDIDAVVPKKKAAAADRSSRPTKSLPKWTAPPGMSTVNLTTDFTSSPFEWDAMAASPGIQLWAIRVPIDFKPSRLSGLSLKAPTKSHPTISGKLKTKSHTYRLESTSSLPPAHETVDEDGRHPTAGPGMVDAMAMDKDELKMHGGEEMLGGMRLMVPRAKKGGKLFVAPLPISQHLLLTPELLEAEIPESTSSEPRPLPSFLSTAIPENTTTPETALPPKRPQPTSLLKFRNKAYGFDTPGPGAEVEIPAAAEEASVSKKKRKSEGEKGASPVQKKSKKVKA
ncbi:hypothetical protein P7C73_g1221, partial [Tremellales sp. Uapishka_1]